eukprot:TRINITY_DN10231_c0_g1_i1.p1 TRINITY_DN10231_c0_g1~~TRINITY_DN10231_c0_g1_i1.p1  ORF type:complete len:364 (+),score=50.39 TRINITY_DN10231_c0_g1_i1:50-1141(+)
MEDAVRIAKQNLVRDLHGTDWFHITFTLLSIQCLSVILKKLNTQTSTEILFSSLYVISITFSPETTPFFVLITNLWILWDYFAVSKADYEKLAVKALQDLHAKRRPYFTNSRSLLLLVTCYAIIAVDFPLFPRIHAKCEDYGKSLMDFGVGLFITSNSLSSRRSFLQNKGVLERFLSGLRGTSLLLIIGLARFVSIRFLNYQEHVSEFGVHWNFFITLSLLHLYASVVCFNHQQSWKAGLVYIFIQQVYLSLCGGSTFILSQHRDSFLSKNKEGVLSLLGYVALYEISVSVSMWFHTARHQIKDYVNLSRDGILIGLLMLFSAMMLEIVVEPVSRRLVRTYIHPFLKLTKLKYLIITERNILT